MARSEGRIRANEKRVERFEKTREVDRVRRSRISYRSVFLVGWEVVSLAAWVFSILKKAVERGVGEEVRLCWGRGRNNIGKGRKVDAGADGFTEGSVTIAPFVVLDFNAVLKPSETALRLLPAVLSFDNSHSGRFRNEWESFEVIRFEYLR